MALDKRLPAVYVNIEDQSYMSETIEAGRTAFCCLISDRGPHNRVVELNSRQDLYDLFGKPNFTKYGQGHYFIDQHLKRSGKIYVVRPVILEPIGDMTSGDCSSIANVSLRMNDLAYIPEHPLNENGILEYYYTKDDIVRICNDNKVIACFLYLRLKGERVEEGIEELKRMYLEWFLSDIEDVNLYKSEVSINVFRILDDKDKEKVLEVLDINTGERIK